MMEGANVERPRFRLCQATARQVRGRLSRRLRYDRWDRRLILSGAVNENAALDQTVPYGTDPSRGYVPGNELPGYYRFVPTGQAVPRVDFSLILPT
jgi:hypothetical protein